MKLRRRVIMLAVLSATSCLAYAAPFHSEAGRFSIAFPAPPLRDQVSIDTPVGSRESTIYSVNLKSRAFFVTYYDVPKGSEHSNAILLSAERDRGLKNARCVLVTENRVTIHGYTGLESIADQTAGGNRVRARHVIIGHRLYSLLAIGPKDKAMSDASATFLRSFTSP